MKTIQNTKRARRKYSSEGRFDYYTSFHAIRYRLTYHFPKFFPADETFEMYKKCIGK